MSVQQPTRPSAARYSLKNEALALVGGSVLAKDRVASVLARAILEARRTRRLGVRDVELNLLVEIGGNGVLLLASSGAGVLNFLSSSEDGPSSVTHEVVRLAALALMLEVADVDRLPNSLLRRRVVVLESHLGRRRDEEHSIMSTNADIVDLPEEAPNDLDHEEAAIREDRVPDLRLGLEALVADAHPLGRSALARSFLTHLCVLVSQLAEARVVRRSRPEVGALLLAMSALGVTAGTRQT